MIRSACEECGGRRQPLCPHDDAERTSPHGDPLATAKPRCQRCFGLKTILVPSGCFSSSIEPCPECQPPRSGYELLMATAPELRDPENRAAMRAWLRGEDPDG